MCRSSCAVSASLISICDTGTAEPLRVSPPEAVAYRWVPRLFIRKVVGGYLEMSTISTMVNFLWRTKTMPEDALLASAMDLFAVVLPRTSVPTLTGPIGAMART